MAVLTGAQFVKVWEDGLSDKTALYALRNVSTSDTANVSSDFSIVKRAVVLGTTVSGSLSASVATTVVTMPAGLASDAAYMLVWGASA